jgi:hypothetical protein
MRAKKLAQNKVLDITVVAAIFSEFPSCLTGLPEIAQHYNKSRVVPAHTMKT